MFSVGAVTRLERSTVLGARHRATYPLFVRNTATSAGANIMFHVKKITEYLTIIEYAYCNIEYEKTADIPRLTYCT